MLRDFALSQNIIEPNADIDAGVAEKSSTSKMTYSFLGMPHASLPFSIRCIDGCFLVTAPINFIICPS